MKNFLYPLQQSLVCGWNGCQWANHPKQNEDWEPDMCSTRTMVQAVSTNLDGSKRLILDTSRLITDCIVKKHFEMDSWKDILCHVLPGGFFTSLDLVKGYFNVALSEDSKLFCCRQLKG